MTVLLKDSKNTYVGDGTSDVFYITFPLPKTLSEFEVYLTTEENGNITTIDLSKEDPIPFHVFGDTSGVFITNASVKFPVSGSSFEKLKANQKIVIKRSTSITQPYALALDGPLPTC